MSHLLVAFDKFRGSATAAEVDAAAAHAALRAGWTSRVVPMADGGEGLLECVGGEIRRTLVTGPLGDPVEAPWRLLHPLGSGSAPVAVVEMARASGLGLVGGAGRNDPEAATTTGTGELILAAVRAGARRVVVGCGGSATTDGGLGAVEVVATHLGNSVRDHSLELVIACDVSTPFLEAARVFGPQKGADRACVERLTSRLDRLAAYYLDHFGVDVTRIEGGGAAGGLAGGLAVLGGRLVPGFELVASFCDLDAELSAADLLVTGEGRLDHTSLSGKVVGSILARAAGAVPALVVVGSVEPGLVPSELTGTVSLVSLSERFGSPASYGRPAALVEMVVFEHLAELTRPSRRLRPDGGT